VCWERVEGIRSRGCGVMENTNDCGCGLRRHACREGMDSSVDVKCPAAGVGVFTRGRVELPDSQL
jgi:hypothetical protein